MRFRKTVIALAAVAAIGISATAGAHNVGRGDITGYPHQIRMVDLSGYQIVTQYTLGRNTGNTFQQNYLAGGQVSATGLAGPFTGQTFASKIAGSSAEFGANPGPYIAAGLVLFVLTFVVNATARMIVNRRKAFA